MKKIVSFILMFVFLFSALLYNMKSAPANAKYAVIKTSCEATVAEVIDGDSLLVRVNSTGEYALVHMIGIDCEGYTPAYEYVTARLLGNSVFVIPDVKIKSPVDRWNYAYIYSASTNLSITLVANGYAKVKTSASNATHYKELVENEKKAKSRNLGIWNIGSSGPSYVYTGNMVNINTATQTELRENLKISDGIASEIVLYRRSHPFKTIYDIKFVDGMTKEIFDDIRFRIVVCTNTNEASREELAMLIGISDEEADDIIDYRDRNGLSNLTTLYTQRLITLTKFNDNKPFISLENVDKIVYSVPDKVVNINTASDTQMKAIDLTESQINKILENRKTYSFKTITDVAKTLGLSKFETDNFEDNITVKTDINNATVNELRSLFGSHSDAIKNADRIDYDRPYTSMYSVERSIGSEMYNRIKNYIYIDDYETDYVNINIAALDKIISAGFNSTQANNIYSKQPDMMTAKDIPYDLKSLGPDNNVTLFTNVNKASASELMALNRFITVDVAESIIRYRQDQPFGSLDEFNRFMGTLGKGFVYESVKNAITVY